MRQAVSATLSPIFKFRTFGAKNWLEANEPCSCFARSCFRSASETRLRRAKRENRHPGKFCEKILLYIKNLWRHKLETRIEWQKRWECSDLFRKYLIVNRALSSCKGEHLTQIYVVVFWFTRKEFNLGKTYIFFHLRKELPSKMWWSIIENYDQRNIL